MFPWNSWHAIQIAREPRIVLEIINQKFKDKLCELEEENIVTKVDNSDCWIILQMLKLDEPIRFRLDP